MIPGRTRVAVAWLAALAAAATACGRDGGAAPVLRFDDQPASATFGVVELVADGAVLDALEERARRDGWTHVLSVHTEGAGEDAPPVLGDHAIADGRLRFTPRFPPVPGQGYRIHVDASAAGAPGLVLDTVVRVESAARPPDTRVVRVQPTADRLPANLLRMYIEFSSPMSVGEAWDRMRLLDGNGVVVEDALLVVPQELWDPEHRRLTVLFDPGRIKRGVRPNREVGLPLRPGGTYTLVVDDAWTDADGLPLREGFRHTFEAGPPDRDLPDPARWRTDPPRAGSREPALITFDEPLDWGLLHHMIEVRTAGGEAIAGTVEVGEEAMRWTFTPEHPWAAGGYVLRVRTDLEDLAGNNLRAPFDVDRAAPTSAGVEGDNVDLPFVVN